MAQTRQLLAILFADVQGFSALVEADESRAKILRDKFQRLAESIFRTHHGRIVSFLGDGVCCIFRSAVDAVVAAVEVQLQMLQEPTVPLRIGIHLGDVIVEGRDIFGDGVNIASRVESFAVPGSILITEIVYHEIRNQSDIKSVSLGKYEFKNVKESIEVYAISNAGLIIPHQKKLTGKGKRVSNRRIWYVAIAGILLISAILYSYFQFSKSPLDEKSIAVIPFVNVNSNPAEDYLCDGFTEDVLTSLSNIADFKVTSFASTRQYKGTTKTIRQIAGELNVAYILEGSVQRSGNTLRITAQLIKVKDDAHIWAKNYDALFSAILDIQTRVSQEIATALKTKLSKDEKKRIEKHSTQNTNAYELYLKGRYYWNLRTRENLDTAIQYFQKAIEIDPDYALAYSGMADVYTILGDNGYLPVDSVALKAKSAVDMALALDSSLAEVRASYAIYLSSMEGNSSAAIRELEKITRYNPNYASAFQWYAIELLAKGKFETAKEMVEKAVVLDPRSKRIYYTKALIYLFSREPDKAISTLKQAPAEFSGDLGYLDFYANVYYLKGRKDTAEFYARLSNDEILMNIIKRDKATLKKIIDKKSVDPRVSAEQIANYYTKAGEKDSAFVWLNKAVLNKEYGGLKFLAVSPDWDSLRNDPRFALLLQNSGIR
jgi:TolB-like protein